MSDSIEAQVTKNIFAKLSNLATRLLDTRKKSFSKHHRHTLKCEECEECEEYARSMRGVCEEFFFQDHLHVRSFFKDQITHTKMRGECEEVFFTAFLTH